MRKVKSPSRFGFAKICPAARESSVKRFRDVQALHQAYDYRDRGAQTVKLRQIVGSVNRYLDFDARFRLKRDRPRERLVAIRKAMERGRPLALVDLYRIKDEYFVVDGNHRISAAKERGLEELNARVIEFLPSTGTPENILYREKSEFLDRTGLPDSIALTETGQYRQLLGQIERHQQHLQQAGTAEVTSKEAASDWHKTIYSPLVRIIEKAGLLEHFPKRTISDLYAYISIHQWQQNLSRSYGSVIDGNITRNMEEFRKIMESRKDSEYPDMLRQITVFVLINIAAKRESQILDRLFALEEVREVHSVHGSIDVIAKVVLTRNLVSSDAEVISRYVQNNIWHIPGVLSTQTLIPGLSRTKAGHEPSA